METPVNHWEEQKFEKYVEECIDRLHDEDKRLNERLKVVEQQSKQIAEITRAVQKQSDNLTAQAKNIDAICKVQEQESARLKELESKRLADDKIFNDLADLNEWRREMESQDGEKWRSFVKQAVTFAIGVASALLIAYIRMLIGI